jgi:hypothetical protein
MMEIEEAMRIIRITARTVARGDPLIDPDDVEGETLLVYVRRFLNTGKTVTPWLLARITKETAWKLRDAERARLAEIGTVDLGRSNSSELEEIERDYNG